MNSQIRNPHKLVNYFNPDFVMQDGVEKGVDTKMCAAVNINFQLKAKFL